ncbi:MAG: Ig-like domain-containing protein [Bacteroidota bacterium]
MKNIFILFAFSVLLSFSSSAQIATYTGSGGSSTAVVGVPNETVSVLQTAGFGANTPCGSGGISGITVNTIWSTYSTAGPRVFFKITPNAGYMLNVTGFTAGIRRSGAGPVNTRFAYSLDNGATWIDDGVNHLASSGGCGTTLVSSWGGGTLPTSISSTVNGIIIALFPFAPGLSTGTYQVNTIVINGSVVPSCTLPTAYSVTGGGAYCAGGSGVTIGLSGSQSGVTYQLYNGAAAVGTAVAGTGGTLSFGLLTAAGTYTVLATGSTAGCTTPMTGSAVVTVNPLPSAITGSLFVCQGSVNSLGSASAGGAWASGSTAVATIGAFSGTLAGITPGTSTITYTLSTGCNRTAVATVTPAPSAITGTPVVCQGLTTTLSNSVAGGAWSSGNLAVATVGAASGIVTGITGGTAVISYTSASCAPVAIVATVNPQEPVTGTPVVCVGETVTLANANAGGTWTSSAGAFASVGAFTGIVAGISAGTSVISYMLPTGCTSTVVATINAAAATITGITNVCVGLTTALASTSAGGTWSSSNTLVATISASGVVSGAASGSTIISYTLPTGCAATVVVTVSPLPAAITGSTFVCQGSAVTLSNASPGGVWSSSNPSVAAVSLSGVVSGIAIGTANITYTLPTGCLTQIPVSVNPLPAAITGVSMVCIGLSAMLSDATAGGTWMSGNTMVATVGAGTGIVTGVAAGTSVISYVFGTGCYVVHTMTVNTPGAAIVGPAQICAGSNITLSNVVLGGIWSSSTPAVASVSTSGVVSGLSAGTTTVSYTTASCNPSVHSFTVHPLPAPITGIFNVCVGSVTTMATATTGGTWSSSSPLASISSSGVVTGLIPGTSAVITYTLPTGCITTVPIVVDSLPAPIAGPDSVCKGRSVTLSDATAGGVWTSSNGTIATAIAATGVVMGVASGSVTISYTLVTGCHVEMNFRVKEPLPASVSIEMTPDTGILCSGTPVSFIAHAVNGGAHPAFMWQKFTVDTAVGDTFTYVPVHGDFISVFMTVDGICAAPDPATDYVYMNVYPSGTTPSITISTSTSPLELAYLGQVFTFYSDVTYGGSSPAYQWFRNDVAIPGATNSSFSTPMYRSEIIFCRVTGNPPCAVNTTGTSNSIIIHSSLDAGSMSAGEAKFLLFPNPNTGRFTLKGKAAAPVTEMLTIEVTNMLGQSVFVGQAMLQNGEVSYSLDLSIELAAGTYLLKLSSASVNEVFHFIVSTVED